MSGKKRVVIYGGDLETDYSLDKTNARVVQWAISNGRTELIGKDINSLQTALVNIMKKEESIIYFHNLKYDLEFIKYILFDLQEDGFIIDAMMRMGNPIYIHVSNPDTGLYYPLYFRDSLKKMMGTLKSVAKIIGMEKLEGYDFVSGWSNKIDMDNPNSWKYVKMDARIVAVAMQKLHDAGHSKATTSGDAWSDAHKIINGKTYNGVNSNWHKYFPVLDIETDSKLRDGYTGGLNISRNKGNNLAGDIGILHADVNSMYPTVMYYDELPLGLPIHRLVKPTSKLWTIKADFKFKLKPGLIPWFSFKHSIDYMEEGIEIGEPITSTKHYHTLTLTSVDLNLLEQWYYVDIINIVEYFEFKSTVGLFSPYIDKWMAVKKKAVKNSLEYIIAKRMMNASYGRFGLNPNGEDITLIIDPKVNDVRWHSETNINETDAYLPYAMFITAYARARLLDYVIKAGCDNIIHCDTDSCIHYGKEVTSVRYGKNLGEWDIESKPYALLEGGFKRYIEIFKPEFQMMDNIKSSLDKYMKVTCAGVPNHYDNNDLPIGMWLELWDNPNLICSNVELGQYDYEIKSEWLKKLFKDKNVPIVQNTMKLIQKKVIGGVLLEDRKHKLDDCLMIRGGRK